MVNALASYYTLFVSEFKGMRKGLSVLLTLHIVYLLIYLQLEDFVPRENNGNPLWYFALLPAYNYYYLYNVPQKLDK